MSDSGRVFGRRVGRMHERTSSHPQSKRTPEQKEKDFEATMRGLDSFMAERRARIESTRGYRIAKLKHRHIMM